MKWDRNSQNGDETIFRGVVENYYAQLCAFSVQYTDSITISEDLVQDVLLRFWEEKKYLLAKDNLRAYVFKAVRNVSIDYIRKNRLQMFTALEEATYLSEEEISEADLEAKHSYLYNLLDQLPPQERLVLQKIVVENKKYKDVAQEMNISVNTVKTHLSRAMKFLRKNNVKIFTLFLFS